MAAEKGVRVPVGSDEAEASSVANAILCKLTRRYGKWMGAGKPGLAWAQRDDVLRRRLGRVGASHCHIHPSRTGYWRVLGC